LPALPQRRAIHVPKQAIGRVEIAFMILAAISAGHATLRSIWWMFEDAAELYGGHIPRAAYILGTFDVIARLVAGCLVWCLLYGVPYYAIVRPLYKLLAGKALTGWLVQEGKTK
jgi:hypothetical protein